MRLGAWTLPSGAGGETAEPPATAPAGEAVVMTPTVVLTGEAVRVLEGLAPEGQKLPPWASRNPVFGAEVIEGTPTVILPPGVEGPQEENGPGDSAFPPMEMLRAFMDTLHFGTVGPDGDAEAPGFEPSLNQRPKPSPEPKEGLHVIHGTLALARHPTAFLGAIRDARERAGAGAVLHLPAIASPSNLPLLCYLGCDSFDTFRALAEASLGYMLGPEGKTLVRDDFEALDTGRESMGRPTRRPDAPPDGDRRALARLRRLGGACHCPSCGGAPVADMPYERLAGHNVYALLAELECVRAVAGQGLGHLRALAESRAASDAWSNRVLRTADSEFYAYLEEGTPAGGEGDYPCRSPQSVHRPAVRRFRERLADVDRYVPSDRPVLLLLPCSARKPYRDSPSHKRFSEVLGHLPPDIRGIIHEAVVTSPLGVVPRELETFFPAAHYDMPATGVYDEVEREMIRESLRTFLGRGSYNRIICHLTSEVPFTRGILLRSGVPVIFTLHGGEVPPSSSSGLGSLRNALRELYPSEFPDPPRTHFAVEDARAKLRFQFGPVGASLLEGGGVRAQGPWYRRAVFDGDVQLCVLDASRGMASLSLEGAKRLYALWKAASEGGDAPPGYMVRIGDFTPKGNIFAVGVEGACPAIRPGDEVVVVHGDEVRAVGKAVMCGRDMVECQKGLAVDVRHRV